MGEALALASHYLSLMPKGGRNPQMIQSQSWQHTGKWYSLKCKLKGINIKCFELAVCNTDPGIVIKLLVRLEVSLNPSWINMILKSSQED